MGLLKRRSTKAALVAALAAMAAATLAGPAFAVSVTGAGATFPAPLYNRWASHFKGAAINYQPTGSGAGIAAIKAGTVSFGGTDAPLSAADLSKFGLIQFPTCVGGLVPIVNIPGVGTGRLKLTGTILAGIYLGTIKTWNNPAIKALNPGLSLSGNIYPVHRIDGSGSTWIFTHYLTAINGSWAKKVGFGTTVRWPIGAGAKGSDGVATMVKQGKGRIGYVEYAYAQQARIPYVQMRNKALKFVQPSLAAFKAAAASVKWVPSAGFATVMVNASGNASWPIAGASFVLVKKTNASYAPIHATFQYFNFGYTSTTGKADATALKYVSMPSSVVTAVKKVWHTVKAGGKAAW